MKAYKVTLLIIDHDRIGEQEIVSVLENARYPNRCIMPNVKAIESRDIGDWDDDHPLNVRGKSEAAYAALFAPEVP